MSVASTMVYDHLLQRGERLTYSSEHAAICDMETLNGFTDPKKPLITSYSAKDIAMLTVTDTIFLTISQKREIQLNRSSP